MRQRRPATTTSLLLSSAVLAAASPALASPPGQVTPKGESEQEAYQPRDFGWSGLSPTAAFGVGASGGEALSLHLWLGLKVHPKPRRLSPFVAVGSAFDAVGKSPRFAIAELAPQLRVGVSLLPAPPSWKHQTFPTLTVYGLAGWRFEVARKGGEESRGDAARLGLGFTWLAFARWQAGLFRGGGLGNSPPAIPWSVEVNWDFDDERTRSLWFSYQF